MGVHIKTVTINGREFRIEVDNAGDFSALIDDERIEEKTLAALTERLTKLSRSKAKPVPFCRIIGNTGNGYKLVDGVITKRNIANRNLMVKINGKTDQEYGHRTTDKDFIRPLSDDEKIIYVNLYLTLQKAEQAIENFEESRYLDVKQALGEKE